MTDPAPEPPRTPIEGKAWAVFCMFLALGVAGLVTLAVIMLVTWVTSQ